MFMGEELKRNINCTKLYIDGKEFEGVKDFSAILYYEAPDNDSNINLKNNHFSCSLRIADKKLNKHYHLMNNSKNWRIRKKNRKKYDKRFTEIFGAILGIS